MKLAIIRTANGALNPNRYNVQEIGLAKSLIKLGVSVDLYSLFQGVDTPTISEKHQNATLKLIPLKGFRFRQITWFWGLKKLLQNGEYDYLQVHEDSQLMTPVLLRLAKRAGIKTILYQGMYANYTGIAGIYQKLLDGIYKKQIKRNTDFVFAKTNAARKYLEKKGYKNVSIQPIGLDFDKEEASYSGIEELTVLRKKVEHLLLYVGVIEPRRDLMFLLDVFQQLIETKGTSGVGLIIVGDGPDLSKICAKVSALNLTSNVTFINAVPNNQIADIYKMCDLFLLPSHYEIYGMVVMEAIYNGIPVISSDAAGPTDIVIEEYLGKTMPMDKDLWVRTINSYLKSSGMHSNYETKRRNYIMEHYSWSILAEQYLQKINL